MSHESTAELYERFASEQARGRSPLYEELARQVARSGIVLEFLAALPAGKRQPNLLLGAIRYLGHAPGCGAEVEHIVCEHGTALRACMLGHTTQTNEPGRCAVLLPVLCSLTQPIALLEVGASAGLCLLPDHYAYDYGSVTLRPEGETRPPPPLFRCAASAGTPLPERLPEVVWRAGIDLEPVDLSNRESADWLRALVWPDQPHRAENLDRAIEVARAAPPDVIVGDLLERLPEVAAGAPADATLVIFHSATLFYLTPEARTRFAAMVSGLSATWISNEGARVLPDIAASVPKSRTARHFVLGVDGRAVAVTGPHGQSIDWLT